MNCRVKMGPLAFQALGDAYGAGFEYAPENAHLNDLTHFLKHPRLPIGGGRYTDDTQMSLAVAEVLAVKAPWTKIGLARSFFNAFKRDERPGYSSKFYEILQRSRTVDAMLAAIVPDSQKNGAAMRAPIIGLMSDTGTVAERAIKQASITHDTLAAKGAAVAAAFLTHYFHYSLGPKHEVGIWLDTAVSKYMSDCDLFITYRWSEPWVGEVGGLAVEAVRAAVTAITKYNTLGDILKASIDFGGDVDTVGAIVMPAASRSVEVTDDIPDALVEQLEDGPFGLTYLCELDTKLLSMWPGRSGPMQIP